MLLRSLNQKQIKKHPRDYLYSCLKGYALFRKGKLKGKAFSINNAIDGKKIARLKLNIYGSKSLYGRVINSFLVC